MTAVLRILALWRGRAPSLALGIMASLLALAAAVALMALSGALVADRAQAAAGAGAAVGTMVGVGALLAPAAALRVVGPARVVLRYAERLLTHGAMFLMNKHGCNCAWPSVDVLVIAPNGKIDIPFMQVELHIPCSVCQIPADEQTFCMSVFGNALDVKTLARVVLNSRKQYQARFILVLLDGLEYLLRRQMV